jgi:hypothetical protein
VGFRAMTVVWLRVSESAPPDKASSSAGSGVTKS